MKINQIISKFLKKKSVKERFLTITGMLSWKIHQFHIGKQFVVGIFRTWNEKITIIGQNNEYNYYFKFKKPKLFGEFLRFFGDYKQLRKVQEYGFIKLIVSGFLKLSRNFIQKSTEIKKLIIFEKKIDCSANFRSF